MKKSIFWLIVVFRSFLYNEAQPHTHQFTFPKIQLSSSMSFICASPYQSLALNHQSIFQFSNLKDDDQSLMINQDDKIIPKEPHAMDHENNSATPGPKSSVMYMQHDDHDEQYQAMPMKRLSYSWLNPKITPSAPPPLTGKQMGVVTTLGMPPLGYEMDGDVKVFTLIAQPIKQYITDGTIPTYDKFIKKENRPPKGLEHHSPIIQELHAWGFNGTTPGPTIECTEGDRIRIVVKNELPEPLTVHKHGIELPVNQDGEGGFEEPVIMPGASRNYEFTLYQSGTYFYHGEFNLMKATGYGLAGALVVHPKKYEHKIDKQFVITLQEWRILPGNVDPDLVSMDFNWFTFNGHASPTVPEMTVNQYERVRIRIINMSMNNHPIHMHGHTWWLVGTEAGPIPKSAQWPVNSVDVPPGASRDVEFVAWNPGLWFFHCHKVHHVMNAHADVPLGVMPHGGMFTLLHVIAKDPDAPWQHPKETGWDVSRDGHDD